MITLFFSSLLLFPLFFFHQREKHFIKKKNVAREEEAHGPGSSKEASSQKRFTPGEFTRQGFILRIDPRCNARSRLRQVERRVALLRASLVYTLPPFRLPRTCKKRYDGIPMSPRCALKIKLSLPYCAAARLRPSEINMFSNMDIIFKIFLSRRRGWEIRLYI